MKKALMFSLFAVVLVVSAAGYQVGAELRDELLNCEIFHTLEETKRSSSMGSATTCAG